MIVGRLDYNFDFLCWTMVKRESESSKMITAKGVRQSLRLIFHVNKFIVLGREMKGRG